MGVILLWVRYLPLPLIGSLKTEILRPGSLDQPQRVLPLVNTQISSVDNFISYVFKNVIPFLKFTFEIFANCFLLLPIFSVTLSEDFFFEFHSVFFPQGLLGQARGEGSEFFQAILSTPMRSGPSPSTSLLSLREQLRACLLGELRGPWREGGVLREFPPIGTVFCEAKGLPGS